VTTRRALLDALARGPVPAAELADRPDASPAAVREAVAALRTDGFRIEETEEGYAVRDVPAYGGDALAFGLSAPYRIDYHETLPSTNDRARELAAGGGDGVAVVANEQTGGRGRLDRDWASPPGGVYLSLALRPAAAAEPAASYTLAAAVAATRACRTAGADAVIKWPNDVLLAADRGGDGDEDGDGTPGRFRRGQGGKLAGVFTAAETGGGRVAWLVVGIGVNANVDADALPQGATSLRQAVGDVDRRAFVHRLLGTFHDLAGDVAATLAAWRDHETTLGRAVRVETPGGTVEGEAVDVEPPGTLVVRTPEGDRRVRAGDCRHLRPAGAGSGDGAGAGNGEGP